MKIKMKKKIETNIYYLLYNESYIKNIIFLSHLSQETNQYYYFYNYYIHNFLYQTYHSYLFLIE